MGSVHRFGAGGGRGVRRVPGEEFRSRSQGARRTGSDGRDLLPQRRHPAGGGSGQIDRLGYFHRKRRIGGPRRAHHPDRRGLWVHGGTSDAFVALAAHHAHCRGHGRRHRGDVQYSGRRSSFRRRIDDARSQRQNASSRGDCHRDRDVYRAAVLRPASFFLYPGFRDALLPSHPALEPGFLCRAGHPHGAGFGPAHRLDLRLREILRAANPRRVLRPARAGDARGGSHDVRDDGAVRPLLHRGG